MRIKTLILSLSILLISMGLFSNFKQCASKDKSFSRNKPISFESGPIHWDEEISPNGLYRGDSFTYDYDDRYTYYRLFITNLQNGQVRKIYNGDFRTLGWEWIKENRIKIFYNCGTGCLATKIIGVNESISLADYKNGGMNKKNGWEVEFLN